MAKEHLKTKNDLSARDIERLEEFKNKILAVSGYSEDNFSELFQEYRELSQTIQSKARDFSPDDLEARTHIAQIFFRVLHWGVDSVEDFKEVATIVASGDSGADGYLKLVEFLKTEQGFLLAQAPLRRTQGGVNRDELTDAEEAAAVAFFGGQFGFDMASDLSKSLRAERIGSLIAYAASGLWESDRKNAPQDPTRRVKFILDCAAKSDQDFRVNFEQNIGDTSGVLLATNKKNNGGSMRRVVRGSGMPDHFCINTDMKTLVVGNTTSNKDTKEQTQSFLRYFAAAWRATKAKTPYAKKSLYGFSLNPFYFLTGMFPSSPQLTCTQFSGRDLVKSFKTKDGQEISGITMHDKKNLGQLSYLGLLGNINTPEKMAILFSHNPIIAGTDTLDLYSLSLKVRGHLDTMDFAKAQDDVLPVVIKKLSSIAKTLTLARVGSELAEDNFKACLSLLSGVVQKLPHNFTDSLPHYTKELKDLHKNLQALYDAKAPFVKEEIRDDFLAPLCQGKGFMTSKTELSKQIKEIQKNRAHSQPILRDIYPDDTSVFDPLSAIETKDIEKFDLGAIAQVVQTSLSDVLGENMTGATRMVRDFMSCVEFDSEKGCLFVRSGGQEVQGFNTHYEPSSVYQNIFNLKGRINKELGEDLRASGYEFVVEFLNKSSFLFYGFSKQNDNATKSVGAGNPKKMRKLIDFLNQHNLLNPNNLLQAKPSDKKKKRGM